MKTIAFGHRKRVGKDTAGRILLGELRLQRPDINTQCRCFAYKLKQMCQSLYGWAGVESPEYYDNFPEKRSQYIEALGMTVRDLWIKMGMKIREIYPLSWIDFVIKSNNCHVLIITDLRFPNEAQYLKQNYPNTLFIRIDRPEIPETNDEADVALADFNSWDRIIINDGDLKSYAQKISHLAKEVINEFNDSFER